MNKSFQCRLLALTAVAILLGGCSRNQSSLTQNATVAVEGDVDSFNPLFAEEQVSVSINELMFPRLLNADFDARQGELVYAPYLAKSWEYSADGKDITFRLRTDARWSDGVRVTAEDVRFSFMLYADTAVGSVRQSNMQSLRKFEGKADVGRAVVALNDSTVVVHFDRQSPSQLFDIGVPLVPHHIFSAIPKTELRTHPVNRSPVTSGPFRLGSWSPMQEIVLTSSKDMGEEMAAKLEKLIFKILPDPRGRLAQLESGEVDVVAGLRPEDAKRLDQNANLKIHSAVGRDYDFIGWNNIDPVAFEKSGGTAVVPHKLFGNPSIRRALTLGINRQEIVAAYLGKFGEESIGGVSPLFKWAYNDTITPLQYDRSAAKALLEREGWRDSDGDGVLDRGGVKFSFSLMLASGNQLRDVIATVIQRQLKELKIEMRIEQVERGTFWNSLIARKYDAWFAGFSVPLQMRLDDLWGSDLRRYPFNLAGFRNKRVDEILAATQSFRKESDGAPLWKEFQVIVHNEQPYTFLFWIHNIVAVNNRLKNTHIGELGVTHKAWEWTVSQ